MCVAFTIQNIITKPICNFTISTDDQCTPAHYASASGRVQCFQCLLEHGADISLKNSSGENPLDVARKHGKPHAINKAGMHNYIL